MNGAGVDKSIGQLAVSLGQRQVLLHGFGNSLATGRQREDP
jgi:hypothetical protein